MNKNKVIIILLVIAGLLFAYMELAYWPKQERIKEEAATKQLDPLTHDFQKVMLYKNEYMGNAGNTTALFRAMPLQPYVQSFEMDSDLFLLTVHYDSPENLSTNKVRQSIIYDSTAAFVLIQNLQQLELRFPDQTYTIHRSQVEKWFSNDLSVLADPDKFKAEVQQPLKSEDLEEWLAFYTQSN